MFCYAAMLKETESIEKKGGYKNLESSASCLSSPDGAKKQTCRQERRFGGTWIRWMRSLSDCDVEKAQVNTVIAWSREDTVDYSSRGLTVLCLSHLHYDQMRTQSDSQSKQLWSDFSPK